MGTNPTKQDDRRRWVAMSVRNVGNVAEVMRGGTGTKKDGGASCLASRKATGSNC